MEVKENRAGALSCRRRLLNNALSFLSLPFRLGDPLRYHSHFTATVQTASNSTISTLELIASGRLGTAVKKAHLLCGVSLSDENKEIIPSTSSSDDETSTARMLVSGQMDSRETSLDGSGNRDWGKVTFYSLTWAGFGT